MLGFPDSNAQDPAPTISGLEFQLCSGAPGSPSLSQLLSPNRNTSSQTAAEVQVLEPQTLTYIESQESLAWLTVQKTWRLPLQLQSKAARWIITGLGKEEKFAGYIDRFFQKLLLDLLDRGYFKRDIFCAK